MATIDRSWSSGSRATPCPARSNARNSGTETSASTAHQAQSQPKRAAARGSSLQRTQSWTASAGSTASALNLVSRARVKSARASHGRRQNASSAPRESTRESVVLAWKIMATASTLAGCTRKRPPAAAASSNGIRNEHRNATSTSEAAKWRSTFTRWKPKVEDPKAATSSACTRRWTGA